MNIYRGKHTDKRIFIEKYVDIIQISDKIDVKSMSFEDFIEIESTIDVGENDLVPVSIHDDEFVLSPNNPDSILTLDLKTKLTPVLTLVNQVMKKWKNPTENTVILSEICLKSWNRKDPLRFKLPNDQYPYGTKFYGITDTDLYLHGLEIRLPKPFETWNNMKRLIDRIVIRQFPDLNEDLILVTNRTHFSVSLKAHLNDHHVKPVFDNMPGFNFNEYEMKVKSYGITRVYKKRWIRQFIQMLFSILIQNIWALYIATYPEDSSARPMDHSHFIKQIAFELIGKEQPNKNEHERNSIKNLKIPPIYLQPELDPEKKSASRKNKCKVDDCHLKSRKRCKMSCPMCKNAVCTEHIVRLCLFCVDETLRAQKVKEVKQEQPE